MDKAKAAKREIVLPVDAVVAEKFEAHAPSPAIDVDRCRRDDMILDIGREAIEHVVSVLARAPRWCGTARSAPSRWSHSTPAPSRSPKAAARTHEAGKLVTVAGGGDTVAALNVAGVVDRLTYVSTAGGAFLEWLEGKPLPGVEVLGIK